MYKQKQEIVEVIDGWSQKINAHLVLLDQLHLNRVASTLPKLKELPAFQQRNFLLAYSAYEYVAGRDDLMILSADKLSVALSVKVPARMDIARVNGKDIIMDGAHNGQKIGAFTSSFVQLYPHQKAVVLLSLKKGKEFQEILPLLLPITRTLIVCDFKTLQDTYLSSIDPDALAKHAKLLGFEEVIVMDNPHEAYELLLKKTVDVGVITGSFYLIGELRRKHKELINA